MPWAFLAELHVSGEPAGKLAESLLGVEEEEGTRKGMMRLSVQRHDGYCMQINQYLTLHYK